MFWGDGKEQNDPSLEGTPCRFYVMGGGISDMLTASSNSSFSISTFSSAWWVSVSQSSLSSKASTRSSKLLDRASTRSMNAFGIAARKDPSAKQSQPQLTTDCHRHDDDSYHLSSPSVGSS